MVIASPGLRCRHANLTPVDVGSEAGRGATGLRRRPARLSERPARHAGCRPFRLQGAGRRDKPPQPLAQRPRTPEGPHVRARQEAREQGRARLFRRPRHLDHPQVAADDLRLRGGHLHRRPRPGRGTGAGPPQGGAARHQAREHLHRGPARGVRARLRVPDVPRQRGLRGRLPARHLDRPAADRQEADRDRRAARRRRGLPRRHRQGQRPGPVRARLLRPQARRDGHRALARMGPEEPRAADRLRRAAPDPDRQGQARREPVLGGRQPPARLLRGQGAGGPGRRGAGLRLLAHDLARGGARHAHDRHHRLREGRRGLDRRRGAVAGLAAGQAQPARPRQRHRPARPRREPLRRHEEPRHVRDARRHHPAAGPPRDRVDHAGPRRGAPQGPDHAAIRGADLQRLLVLARARDAAGADRQEPGDWSPARSG